MSDKIKVLIVAGTLIGSGICLGINIASTYGVYKQRKRVEKVLAEEEAFVAAAAQA